MSQTAETLQAMVERSANAQVYGEVWAEWDRLGVVLKHPRFEGLADSLVKQSA